VPGIIGGAEQINPGGNGTYRMGITPDGRKGYVANFSSNTVTPLTLTRPGNLWLGKNYLDTPGTPIAVGTGPFSIACTATFAVVCNYTGVSVTVITIATNTVARTVTLPAGSNPRDLAQGFVYVGNFTDSTLLKVATADGTVAATIALGTNCQPAQVRTNAATGSLWVVCRNANKLIEVLSTGSAPANTYNLTYAAPFDFVITPSGKVAYVIFDSGYWAEMLGVAVRHQPAVEVARLHRADPGDVVVLRRVRPGPRRLTLRVNVEGTKPPPLRGRGLLRVRAYVAFSTRKAYVWLWPSTVMSSV
jgi:DNA-binding beta-propeller fold protein YncE